MTTTVPKSAGPADGTRKFLGDLSPRSLGEKQPDRNQPRKSVWDLVEEIFILPPGSTMSDQSSLRSHQQAAQIQQQQAERFAQLMQGVAAGEIHPINRICFVSQFTSKLQNKKDLSTWYEDFWEHHAIDVQTGGIISSSASGQQQVAPLVTGIALVLPQSSAHFVEAPPKVISALLREIASSQQPFLKDVKIVAVHEDVSSRCFRNWDFRVLQYDRMTSSTDSSAPPGAAGGSNTGGNQTTSISPSAGVSAALADEEDKGNTIANSCYMNLIRLGEGLRRDADANGSGASSWENMKNSQLREFLPNAEIISALIASKDLFTLSEWLTIYDHPVNLDLDPGQVNDAGR